MRWLFPVALGLALLTAALQLHWGAYRSEFARHPDEPAHYITGRMVFDYLTTAAGTAPLSFAQEYYARYPKVAFGHWPPGFYLLQALWYAIAGTSLTAAMALVGVCAAATAILLWWKLRPAYGCWLAVLAAALFLCRPVTARTTACFLADVPMTLFCLLALFAFADFLRTGQLRASLAFAIYSSAAILVKGNALALALLPPLAILLTGRWSILKSWKLWLSAVIVFALCYPCYHIGFSRAVGVTGGGAPSAGTFWRNLLFVLAEAPEILGVGIIGLAVVGAGNALRRLPAAPEAARRFLEARVALAWAVAVLSFHVISPISREPRYLLAALPACLILAAEALLVLQSWLGRRFAGGMAARAVPALLCLPLALPGWQRPDLQVSGYRQVAEALQDTPAGAAVLVASDPRGEGALIVERRRLDHDRTSCTLRASKVLAKDTWSGSHYQLRMREAQVIRRYLLDQGVHYIVVDTFGYRHHPSPPHNALLKQALERYPEDFVLLHRFDASHRGQEYPGGILVYQKQHSAGRSGTAFLPVRQPESAR